MKGELSFESMKELLPQADQLAASGTIDLADITKVDSAGVAFLLELTRRAKKHGRTLEFTRPSQQLRGLLEFLQLDGVLKLAV